MDQQVPSTSVGRHRRRDPRLAIGISAIAAAVLALILGVWTLTVQGPRRLVVIGGLSGEALFIIALIVAAVGLTIAFALIFRRAWRSIAILPAVMAAMLFVVGAAAAPAPLVPLKVDGCVSQYLVADKAPGGLKVYLADGAFADEVLHLNLGDSFGAFTNRHYRTAVSGSELQVWYESSSARSSRDLSGDPAFVLPVSTAVDCT